MAEVIERGRTEQVGAAAGQLLNQLTIGTDFSAFSTPALRLDDQQIAELQQAANLPLPAPPPPCDEDHFDKCMRSLSILPRKAEDQTTGALRAKLYGRLLGHFDRAAISYMTETALATCRWFPTPAECLEILAGHAGSAEQARKDRATAEARIRREMQQRYLDWLMRLRRGDMMQSEVDAAPERWCAVGETQGLLRKDGDGRFVLRAKAVAA
jgi:hypothetical protein